MSTAAVAGVPLLAFTQSVAAPRDSGWKVAWRLTPPVYVARSLGLVAVGVALLA